MRECPDNPLAVDVTADELPKVLRDDVMFGRPNTPPNSIEVAIAKDYLDKVVQGEMTTDIWVMTTLASCKNFHVRASVAVNIHAPEFILDVLAVDKVKKVRDYVRSNPNTSPATRLYLLVGEYQGMTLQEFKAVMDKTPSRM